MTPEDSAEQTSDPAVPEAVPERGVAPGGGTSVDPAGRWAGHRPPGPPAAFAEYVSWAQWRPLAIVLLGAVFAIGMTVLNFRLGAVLLAVVMILAFLQRLLLTEEAAGLLAVRSRRVDLVILAILAVGTSLLAIGVPATFTPTP